MSATFPLPNLEFVGSPFIGRLIMLELKVMVDAVKQMKYNSRQE
jgi:hypothetical protein